MTVKFIVKIDKDLEEILPVFLENRQKDLLLIKVCIESNDLDKIEVLAHKLAGNAGSYGFVPLGELGAQLEVACKQQDKQLIMKCYDEYFKYMTNLEVEFV